MGWYLFGGFLCWIVGLSMGTDWANRWWTLKVIEASGKPERARWALVRQAAIERNKPRDLSPSLADSSDPNT